MALTYELWNDVSGNRVGEFESQDEALASVRRTMQRHGAEMIEALALGYEDDDGEGAVIARGADLAALAQPHTPHPVVAAS